MVDHRDFTKEWSMDQVILAPGTASLLIAHFRRREQDLLKANNRYLERARAAEAAIACSRAIISVSDEMIEAAALSDAEFDGRNFVCMGRVDRERYMIRAKASLTAALSALPTGIPFGWSLIHDKHFSALADGMAEIKATSDGQSDQPIADIVAGVLAEIADAPPPIQGFSALPAGVKVKPLEWVEHWGGADDDLPSWRGKNPLGLHVSVDFIGKYKLDRHSDAPQDELEAAKAAAQADYSARILSALSPAGAKPTKVIEPTYTAAEYDEAYELGKRDGYSDAVKQIDQLTGGDGEYRYCSDHAPERHTPGPAEMVQRIVDRFETLNLIDDAAKSGRDQDWGLSAISPAGVETETPAPSPAPSTHVVGRWLPIAQADRTITNVEDFSEVGVILRTSDRYWVRDEDGRVYEAAWSEGNNGERDYWWDFEGESPVDPVEFMPHPLDPRFATTEGK